MLALFREDGFDIAPAEIADRCGSLRGLLRLFHVWGKAVPSEAVCLLCVSVAPWEEAHVEAFLASWLPMLQEARLHARGERTCVVFRGAYPLPPALRYLFSDSNAAHLEVEFLGHTQALGLRAAAMPELGRLALRALRTRFSGDLALHDRRTLGALQEVVLGHLRQGIAPYEALEAGSYVPVSTLAALGALLGEVLRQVWLPEARWVDTEGDGYPALEVRRSHGASEQVRHVYPLDRLCHLYLRGAEYGLSRYSEGVIQDVVRRPEHLVGALARWEDAADLVLPVLRPAGWHQTLDTEAFPLYASAPRHAPEVLFALDEGTQLRFVSAQQRRAWGMSQEELAERARYNLARRSREMFTALRPVELDGLQVLALDYPDDNAARILLTDHLARAARRHYPGYDRFSVGVPNRDRLLLMPAPEDQAERLRFRRLLRACYERHPAPLTPLCFVLGSTGLLLCPHEGPHEP
jgi:uncharacterized protein YtpQ (UPF0354 family)